MSEVTEARKTTSVGKLAVLMVTAFMDMDPASVPAGAAVLVAGTILLGLRMETYVRR